MKKLRFKRATYNVLDFIDRASPLAIDDCNGIAQALVVRTGEEKEPHFPDRAEEYIAAVAATVVQYGPPGRRSLQDVADILAHPPKLEVANRLMLESPAWDGMLSRMGGQLRHAAGEEKASVLSTCGRFLRFLSTPAMAAATRTSSFVPQLKKRKQTVYIVLPPERIQPAAGWLRLVVGSLIRSVVREGLGERRRVHFVLDEAASLGSQLDAVESLVDKYRGYGCRAQFYYQSVGQLAKCWPKDNGTTLLSNTSQIYFSVRDLQTANQVSQMLGKETIIVESGGGGRSGGSNTTWSQNGHGGSYGGGRNSGWSTSENWQQSPRDLLQPSEVLALPPRVCLTFPGGGVPPVATTLVRSFEEKGLFTPRGWLSRLGAACRTLVGSALLLASGVLLASAVTPEVAERWEAAQREPQPPQPQPFEPQLRWSPPAPGPTPPPPVPARPPGALPPAWDKAAPGRLPS